MSTVSALPSGELIGAVKGAPETIKTMLTVVPKHYDETYKWFTRRGSRVLALGFKRMRALPTAAVRETLHWSTRHLTCVQINKLTRDEIESGLTFAGFLVFHCPLKPDAVESLKMLVDSSHRVDLIRLNWHVSTTDTINSAL